MFRLIESGAATLQPDRALDLIKALPNTPIEFRQLSVLLVSCVISEHQHSNLEHLRQAIEELATVDKGFGIAIKPLETIWADLAVDPDSHKIAHKLEELAIPDRLLEFLAQRSDPATDQVTPTAIKWGHNLVAGTPPIYLDLVETIVTELKRFPPKVTAHEIAEWEKRHRGRFRRVYALVETVQIITETYSEFDLRWIAGENFEELSIISLAPANHKKQENKSFQEFLGMLEKESWLKQKNGKNVREICQLRFASEQSGFQEKFRLLLSEDSQARTSMLLNINLLDQQLTQAHQIHLKYRNLWAYELISKTSPISGDNYHIAMMDDRTIGSSAGFDVITCSWKETECWVGLLESFWSS
ncbi:MAG TPA: hypothetical protein VJ302_27765 [Blastocatellia bacterium]|nr:hypothetical protein [Blastocatellia bacterium]